MSEKYREYGYDVNSDELSRQVQEDIKAVYAYKDGAMITGNYRDGGYWEDR